MGPDTVFLGSNAKLGPFLSKSGESMAQPLYKALEEYKGEKGAAADVWAAGVILYEMFAESLPFKN